MNMNTKTTIELLTENSVSIKTQKTYIDESGNVYPIGEPHRVAYSNSGSGRKQLQTEQSATIVATVLSMWGNEPTISDTNINNPQV